MEKSVKISKSIKDFVIIHLIFVGLCFTVILIPFPIGMGIKLLVLVAFYNLGVLFLGILRKDKLWIKLFVFTFLISVFQIWPDWFLSAQLNVLVFPEDGSFKIGTVSGYMVGLWTIPLFIICFIGAVLEEEYSRFKSFIVVGLLSFGIFVFAEQTMWMLQSWYPQNVTLFLDHLAIYIIIPEVILGLTTFYYFTKIKSQHYGVLIIVAFGVMLLYLGGASFFYFLFEKLIFV